LIEVEIPESATGIEAGVVLRTLITEAGAASNADDAVDVVLLVPTVVAAAAPSELAEMAKENTFGAFPADDDAPNANGLLVVAGFSANPPVLVGLLDTESADGSTAAEGPGADGADAEEVATEATEKIEEEPGPGTVPCEPLEIFSKSLLTSA
jgi:hypothetical protein